MSNTLIIRKHRFAIEAGNTESALNCRKALNDDWMTNYTQLLHKAMGGLFFSKQDIFIDKMSMKINLGDIGNDASLWANRLSDAFIQQLMQQTGAVWKEEADENFAHAVINEQDDPQVYSDNKLKALLHYLFTGTLPHWCRHLNFSPVEWTAAQLSSATETLFFENLLNGIRSQPQFIQHALVSRFWNVLPENKKWNLLSKAYSYPSSSNIGEWLPVLSKLITQHFQIPVNKVEKQFLLSILKNKVSPIRYALERMLQDIPVKNRQPGFWRGLEEDVKDIGEKWQVTEIIEMTTDIKNDFEAAMEKSASQEPDEDHQLQNDQADEGYYTSQAGLVILHPFLKELFQNAGLLNEKDQFKSNNDQQYGVRMLRYISGKSLADWELTFEKILCGLNVEFFIEDLQEPLLAADQTACNELLQAVLNYWPPLQQSSVEALQETFISHFGKIRLKDQVWQLYVERTGVDILMEQLPWSISMIKLPWQQNLLEVVW